MRPLVTTVLFCLAWGAALAQPSAPASQPDATPTEESIRRLLDVMQAKALVEAMPKQMDAYFNSMLSKQLEDKPLSAQQQQAIDKMRLNLVQMMNETFNWDSMEPLYQEIYGKTFSQSEVDSMISFYSSSAGHAVVTKLPLAMQNTMAAMQQRMQALLPKIQQMAKDMASEIKAQEAPKGPG